MVMSNIAERVRYHKSIAGRIVQRPCSVRDSLFANVSGRARAVVRQAHLGADKTVFVDGVELEAAAYEAEKAGYLSPLRGAEGVFFITERGEDWLAARARAE
jgi:hypothetical protein